MNTHGKPSEPTEADRIRSVMEKVRQIEIRTRRLVDESLAGHYHSVFRGRGIDFDSVREYVAGDEVRTIDWNVTARAGRPFVKQFHEERELVVWILVDVSASARLRLGIRHQAGSGGRAGLRAGALRGAEQRQGGPAHVQRSHRGARTARQGSRPRPARRARDPDLQAGGSRHRHRGGAGCRPSAGPSTLRHVLDLRLRAAR